MNTGNRNHKDGKHQTRTPSFSGKRPQRTEKFSKLDQKLKLFYIVMGIIQAVVSPENAILAIEWVNLTNYQRQVKKAEVLQNNFRFWHLVG